MGLARDEQFMRRALELAERGWGQTAPNPMVGAVVVRGDEVVGEGYHERFGEAHAEANALEAAGARARDATLYVTLEPCNHWGKTPPCAEAVIAAGVKRVVFASHDPGGDTSGGALRLQQSGVEVLGGVLDGENRELNAPFFHAFRSDRPWVTLKLAVSIDGAIADHTRKRGWLTGDAAQSEVHRLRAGVDAIAVGAGTFINDAPRLDVRGSVIPRVQPLRVVFDQNARLSLSRTAVPSAPDVVIETGDVEESLRRLARDGVRSLLVEGGAGLASSLLDANVVDRLVIFQAPIVLGGESLHAFQFSKPGTIASSKRFPVVRRAVLGDDTMTVYALTAV